MRKLQSALLTITMLLALSVPALAGDSQMPVLPPPPPCNPNVQVCNGITTEGGEGSETSLTDTVIEAATDYAVGNLGFGYFAAWFFAS